MTPSAIGYSKRLDELKADGQGAARISEEYMSVLKELQAASKARLADVGLGVAYLQSGQNKA